MSKFLRTSGTREFTILATRQTIALHTTFVNPPIPIRNLDWFACDDNTYDAEYDYDAGQYVSRCPSGQGATEIEAINTLLDRMGEQGC